MRSGVPSEVTGPFVDTLPLSVDLFCASNICDAISLFQNLKFKCLHLDSTSAVHFGTY